ncbi:sugar nucleotide-binding protein [Streptomyces sp. NBC_01352]|uniref:SDR family oxidoreductase n=1 Tax=Streptomyces TaxID=1883 RepID=UPI002E2EEFAC|nr:sugar nucleotide-binding protein [Streptomyces sp. NBC_01352]
MSPANPAPRHITVVGRGLIGSALTAALRRDAATVHTVARSGARTAHHEPCDLGTRHGRDALRAALRRQQPDRVVLTHGPSDVTWMENHPEDAAEAHAGLARAVSEEFGPRILLVSTDNVYPGTDPLRTPADPPAPANVYGHVKLAAEQAVLDAGGHVVRVSLVYGGWSPPGQRVTFAERCLAAARAGQPLAAPEDQWFTPVHLDDVTTVLRAMCGPGVDRSAVEPLSHLSGPRQLSRHDFALAAYRLAGADEALVTPVPRARSEWASRPRYSSLHCDDFAPVTGIPGWQPADVTDGLRTMLTTAPALAEAVTR